MGPVDEINGCGPWIVDILDYLVMQYSTLLVTVLFGSFIPTFCSMFVIFLYSCFFYISFVWIDAAVIYKTLVVVLDTYDAIVCYFSLCRIVIFN